MCINTFAAAVPSLDTWEGLVAGGSPPCWNVQDVDIDGHLSPSVTPFIWVCEVSQRGREKQIKVDLNRPLRCARPVHYWQCQSQPRINGEGKCHEGDAVKKWGVCLCRSIQYLDIGERSPTPIPRGVTRIPQ